jgi:endogenous inhibitor of DNA gyrase (YacG/DUF329 family)
MAVPATREEPRDEDCPPGADTMTGLRSEPLCAYCRRRPAAEAWRPFCSERCKLADLGRWLSGDYRVAGPSVPAGNTDHVEDDSE